MTKQMLFLILMHASIALASHYRGGSISYEFVNETGTDIFALIEHRIAWRRDREMCFCDANTIQSKTLFGEDGKIVCDLNCDPNYSLGATITSVQIYCSSFSVSDNWAYGSRKTLVKMPMRKNIQVKFNGTAW